MDSRVTNIHTDERQEARWQRSGESSRKRDDTLRAFFEEMEGKGREGFMAFRVVRGANDAPSGFRCIYLNRAAEQLLGVGEGDLPHDALLSIMVCRRGGDMFNKFVAAMDSGESSEGQVRGVLDGKDRYYRGLLTPFRDGVTVRFKEVSETERSEEALPRELVYRLLSRVSSDVLWEWNVESGKVWWGEALQRVFGYPLEMVGDTVDWWRERLHPADRDRVMGRLYGALQGSGDSWRESFRYRRADGEYALVLARAFVARDPSGKPLRVVGSLVDLTDRLRSEEALRESEERFRATFNQAAVGIALALPSGTWLRANNKLYDILGYGEGGLHNATVPSLVHPDEREGVLDRLRAVLAGEVKSDAFETRLRKADGSYVWTRVTLSAASCDAGSRWLIAVVEDIQERKRLEQETKRAQEFENQLYGMIGHDLRSPLAALKATVAALRSHPDGLSDGQVRALDRVARSTQRIDRLVHEMLDYTRVRLGEGIPIHPRPTDALSLCEQVMDEFEHTHPGRVSFSSADVDGRARWDPERIKQILYSLVENAVTYGAHDRPAWILLNGNESELTLKVHNDGPPIPPERLPRLFEPFNDGSGVAQTVKLSLGLGLYLVSEVVRAHGGTLSVTSTEQDGTTFIVRLPRYPAQSLQLVAH